MIDEKRLLEDLISCKELDRKSFQTVIDVVNNQSKIDEWIPTSEGLPKDNKLSEYYDAVIVTLDDGRVVNGCYRNIDEEWWVDAEDGEKYSINATGHVIAWMSLPEAYKK